MNSKKTEHITFGSSRQLKKNENRSIDINGDTTVGSTCIRYFGFGQINNSTLNTI